MTQFYAVVALTSGVAAMLLPVLRMLGEIRISWFATLMGTVVLGFVAVLTYSMAREISAAGNPFP